MGNTTLCNYQFYLIMPICQVSTLEKTYSSLGSKSEPTKAFLAALDKETLSRTGETGAIAWMYDMNVAIIYLRCTLPACLYYIGIIHGDMSLSSFIFDEKVCKNVE